MGLRRCLLTALMAAVSLLTVSTVVAQPAALPNDMVMASSPLGAAQQAQVADFVKGWTDKLMSDDAASVAQGRQRLSDPFSLPGASKLFLSAYSSAISKELTSRQALSNSSILVRTNAMIIVSSLNDSGAVPLIQQGMADQSPAVRYWAATAAGNVGSQLKPAEQKKVLDILNTSWPKEAANQVLSKILVAMDTLNTPEATIVLLGVLNSRVSLHAANTRMPIKGEVDALQGVTVRTFSDLTTPDKTVSPDLIKQLVLVLFRYMDLSAGILEDADGFSNQEEDLQRMVLVAGNFLPRLAPRISPEAKSAKIPTGQVNPKAMPATRLLIEEWRRSLSSGSFGITAAQLNIENKPGN